MDRSAVAGRLVQRLAGTAGERYWSACACLWARAFADAHAAWERWQEQYQVGLHGLVHALARTIRGLSDDDALVLEAVRGRPVPEDDGLPEWGRAPIFFEMAEWALDGTSARQCLQKAAQVYLEEVVTEIANELAGETVAGVISSATVRQRVPKDRRWCDAVGFVEAL